MKLTLTTTMKACLLTGVVGAGLTAAIGPGFAVAAAETVQEVFITNDRANRVPVDASGQTITVSGTADVSGSSVEVVDATEPYQKFKSMSPQSSSVAGDLETVPGDRRLTVTNLSVADFSGKLYYTQLVELCNGYAKGFMVGKPETRPKVTTVHAPTTLEVRPGCKLTFAASRTSDSPMSLEVSVTGYWTPVDAAQ